jgi:hypothetical protein
VSWVLREIRAIREMLVLREIKDFKEHQVSRVLLDFRDLPDLQVFLEQRAILEHLAHPHSSYRRLRLHGGEQLDTEPGISRLM